MTSPRPINTSRAYWELRAEQVMDRVFLPSACPSVPAEADAPDPPAADDSIEVEVREAPEPAAPAQHRHHPHRPWPRPTAALLICGGLACLGLASSIGLWLSWNQANQALRQERTIRLLEGIRRLPAAAEASGSGGGTPATNPANAAPGDALPPPPPSEPWIEELGQLSPAGGGGAAAPLRVPLSGGLSQPAPAALPPLPLPPLPAGPGASAVPELVGVVQIPGRAGSAIFQVGGSSTNASAGESIGSSGWRLLSTSGDSAVIERAGMTRRVSIGTGF